MNETNESASAQYETREAEAPKPVKQQLSALRKQAADAEWTFDVGYTTALDLEIEQIAGLVPPENWQAEASAQNALAVAMMDEAPLELDGCEANAAAFNWADNGCVTPVKDQGACGSCWAFGTHGAFEGSYAVLNNHALVDTSEQQTLDCSGAGSCNGGWWAFQYLIDHGTAAESSYPYAGSDGACPNVDGTYWASTWGYVDPNAEIPSVEALKEALCSYGPIAIAVAVTPGVHLGCLQRELAGQHQSRDHAGRVGRRQEGLEDQELVEYRLG
jgi:cathepsin L